MAAGKGERFGIRLPADELAAWERRAEAEGVTVAELVRDAMKRRIAVDVGRASEERRLAVLGRRVVALVKGLDEP